MERNEDAGKYEDENKGNKNENEDEDDEEEEEGTKDDKEKEAVGTAKTINIHEGLLGYIQTSPNAKWVNARRRETVELEDLRRARFDRSETLSRPRGCSSELADDPSRARNGGRAYAIRT